MEADQRIGIGITTRNRREMFHKHFAHTKRYSPSIDIVVVDDASKVPLDIADYRFKEQAGIAKAKNKCIRLLLDKGCTDIFLFDDDIHPLNSNWYKPYVESGKNHLCLSFQYNSKGHQYSASVNKEKSEGGISYYTAPNGCMLYFKKVCFDTVGGFDERFSIWGYEHVQLSHRIHNAGLTESPFMDVDDSLDLFYVADYYSEVSSSVPENIRVSSIRKNTELFNQTKNSKLYVPIT